MKKVLVVLIIFAGWMISRAYKDPSPLTAAAPRKVDQPGGNEDKKRRKNKPEPLDHNWQIAYQMSALKINYYYDPDNITWRSSPDGKMTWPYVWMKTGPEGMLSPQTQKLANQVKKKAKGHQAVQWILDCEKQRVLGSSSGKGKTYWHKRGSTPNVTETPQLAPLFQKVCRLSKR